MPYDWGGQVNFGIATELSSGKMNRLAQNEEWLKFRAQQVPGGIQVWQKRAASFDIPYNGEESLFVFTHNVSEPSFYLLQVQIPDTKKNHTSAFSQNYGFTVEATWPGGSASGFYGAVLGNAGSVLLGGDASAFFMPCNAAGEISVSIAYGWGEYNTNDTFSQLSVNSRIAGCHCTLIHLGDYIEIEES